MPTNKQRREASRRHLERQLERRAEKEAVRKRFTLIASIAGSLVVIAIVIALVVVLGGSGKTTPVAKGSPHPSASSSAPASVKPSASPSTSYPPAKGAAVSFDGVTVTGAKDLSGVPQVTSKAGAAPSKLAYKDLVVGTGKAATPTSTVTVQYLGVLYKNGKQFDSSWKRGKPIKFSLAHVVPGFTQGIGGTSGVPPMKVGGRRIIIMPAALGYGAKPPPGSGIPPNAALVFVIDLKKVG